MPRQPTKRVKAALHAELIEYAALLRAIRTNATLDIVPQLTKASKPHTPVTSVAVDESDHEGSPTPASEADEDSLVNNGEAERDASKSTPHRSQQVKRLEKGKGKAKAMTSKSTKCSKRKRDGDDNWTTWPLLKEHCPLPDWTFDEEIVAMVEQCLRSRSSSFQEPDGADAGATMARTMDLDLDDDDLNDDTLSPAHLSGLVTEAASKLMCILALLAAHRSNTMFTKHGRIVPMTWIDVLEIVGVAGIFDIPTVQSVKERMEAVYGPSHSQVVTRMQVLEASKRALAEAEAAFGDDMTPIGPPRRRRKSKQIHDNAESEPE